jgi:putative thioredoxin
VGLPAEGVSKSFAEQVEAWKGEYQGKLSPEQQRMFSPWAESVSLTSMDRLTDHETRELRAGRIQTHEGAADTHLKNAQDNWTDFATWNGSLGAASAELDKALALKGVSKEMRDAEVAKLQASGALGRVKMALESNRFGDARKMLDDPRVAGQREALKIDIDQHPQFAGQLRVQSIPAVYAFVNGQPVDGFMGALPESQIKQFVDRLGGQGSMAEEIEAAVAEARMALDQQDYQSAGQIFAQVLQVDREHAGALAGLARCQMAVGDLENAQATLALVPPAKASDPEVLSAKAALELALNPVDVSEIGTLKAQIEKNPDDFQARLDLAVLLNGAGERAEATDQLIYIIKKMRSWNEEAARKQLVKFFEAWGPKDEFTLAGRRKLSSVLFS